jgi:hypothetical protein
VDTGVFWCFSKHVLGGKLSGSVWAYLQLKDIDLGVFWGE